MCVPTRVSEGTSILSTYRICESGKGFIFELVGFTRVQHRMTIVQHLMKLVPYTKGWYLGLVRTLFSWLTPLCRFQTRSAQHSYRIINGVNYQWQNKQGSSPASRLLSGAHNTPKTFLNVTQKFTGPREMPMRNGQK